MVQFIGVQDAIEILRTYGVGAFMARLADYIEDDYRRWPEFEKSSRLASHSATGVIELMPTSDGALYSFKYVNGHPANTRDGKLTVTAFGVLAEVSTGYPVLLSEMTVMTAVRTAATSAMAARHLARKDARSMGLVGAGAQSEFQALAFRSVLGIEHIEVFDTDAAASRKFARNLATIDGLTVSIAGSLNEAVARVDIITTATATKARAAVLSNGMIRPGVHINAVGGDCPGKTELDPDILRRARVVVEYLPQSRVEGEIQQLEPGAPAVELWKIVTGQEPGRSRADEITVFDSVGFALEDFSTLRLLRDVLDQSGRSHVLDLVPDLIDPKNLYSLLLASGQAAHGRTAA